MNDIQPGSFRAWCEEVFGESVGPICDHCSEPSDDLHLVEDRDDSVGYRDELWLCQTCIDRIKRK